jgi:hypothetical protein
MGTREVMEKQGEARLDEAYNMLEHVCGYCGMRSGDVGDKIKKDIDAWVRIDENDVRDYHCWMAAAQEVSKLMDMMDEDARASSG